MFIIFISYGLNMNFISGLSRKLFNWQVIGWRMQNWLIWHRIVLNGGFGVETSRFCYYSISFYCNITERNVLNKIKCLILHLHCNVSNMKIRLLLGRNSVWPQMYFLVCNMGLKVGYDLLIWIKCWYLF